MAIASALRTPVALVIFNRPETTRRVFEQIALARPQQLFVIADAPRAGRADDAELCAAARRITDAIDWECDVIRDYAPVNEGAGRVGDGISRAFERVEELIVLEDDCVPHPSFFPYCEELLERYRDDERVMHIAGNHFQGPLRRPTPYSYSFARWNIAWGWATWRRAWQYYDFSARRWAGLRDTNFLEQLLRFAPAEEQYRKIFNDLHDRPRQGDAWDHAWTFACWSQSGFSILPDTTLVNHIGFGPDATHFTKVPGDPRASLTTAAMEFPLRHPDSFLYDRAADEFIMKTYVAPWGIKPPLTGYQKLRTQLSHLLPPVVRRAGRFVKSRLRVAEAR